MGSGLSEEEMNSVTGKNLDKKSSFSAPETYLRTRWPVQGVQRVRLRHHKKNVIMVKGRQVPTMRGIAPRQNILTGMILQDICNPYNISSHPSHRRIIITEDNRNHPVG